MSTSASPSQEANNPSEALSGSNRHHEATPKAVLGLMAMKEITMEDINFQIGALLVVPAGRDAAREMPLEDTPRSQLTDFNPALPGLSDNGTHVYEESSEQSVKAIFDYNLHDNNLDFQLYRVRSQEAKNAKCTPKTEDLLLLDLNIKGGYDLSSGGMQG
ncbi:hypothetical protein ZWY2020_004331 [Hordeum vulgare]|nr:hypothetical protein ZWY2020_004331 [Hordeum vulgare]